VYVHGPIIPVKPRTIVLSDGNPCIRVANPWLLDREIFR